MFFWLFVLSLPLALILWSAQSFWENYKLARQTGLPMVFLPFDPNNLIWIFTRIQLVPYVRALPFGLGRWVRAGYMGWSFQDKYALFEELGSALVIVSPGGLEVHVADAAAVDAIISRRKDFPKPVELYKVLEAFGPNLDTVEGEEWQRHKKITTPPFNERNSNLVWKEALRQATDMLSCWTENGEEGVTSTTDDTMKTALHVITRGAFGRQFDFKSGLEVGKSHSDHYMSHRNSLLLILRNIVLVFMLPDNVLSIKSILPQRFQDVAYAIREFRSHMVEMLEDERRLISKRDSDGNLLSALVQAADAAVQSEGKSGIPQGLNDREIMGNIFIFSLAGHETTSNAMSYSIMMLAAHPEWQDWMSKEINQVLGGLEDIDTWEYEKLFPQLNRCLAVMYETLRLYGSVIYLPKSTPGQPQLLPIQGKDYIIPPNISVTCNSLALQTAPHYWGTDALIWRPSRWLSTDPNPPPGAKVLDSQAEGLIQPRKGTFLPWSDGARVCPGKKFAQVEFVAVMCRLFRRHRVTPVLLPGEDREAVRERIMGVVEDSMVDITLRMGRPESVSLSWAEVSG